jgi:hypothetical protein
MKIARRSLIVASAFALASGSLAAETPVDEALRRISDARSRLRTLSGPFRQTRTIGLLASEVRSSGTLTLVRPDRLRWELAPPDEVTFWVGPEGLAYKSARGSGRLPPTTAGVAGVLADLRALLGGDLSGLSARWSLRVVRQDDAGVDLEAISRSDPSPDRVTTTGAPRSIRLALAADLLRPTRVLLVEGPRDQTSVDFGDLRVNAPVDESSLRPPG